MKRQLFYENTSGMRKAIFFVLIGLFCAQSLHAQDERIENLIPKTPNSTSMSRYGDYPVSMFTGLPDITIPLYEINSPRLKLPIALSYHASGIKVSDVASWVGLGWSLRAGSAVTRKQRGRPDDPDGILGSAMNSNLDPNCISEANNEYLKNIYNGTFDSEPDMFNWSLPNGKSGIFYYKSTNTDNLMVLPLDAVKIKTYRNTVGVITHFIITDTDGTIYRFGLDTDNVSNTESSDDLSSTAAVPITAWMLCEITSADLTDRITLKYRFSSYTVTNDKVQIIHFEDSGTGNFVSRIVDENIGTNLQNKQITYTNYECKLQEITFANGRILFTADAVNRTDIADKRLTGLSIESNVNGTWTGHSFISFLHSYTNGHSRLKLDEVQFRGSNNQTVNSYGFTYNSTPLVSYESYQKDYWGYYNGQTTNEQNGLLPPVQIVFQTQASTYTKPLGSANRQPAGTYMKAGVLEKITYPTGGYTEFEYEPHSYDNGFSQTAMAGGLRIRQIKSYPSSSQTPIIKTYKYSAENSETSSVNDRGRINANTLMANWKDQDVSFRNDYYTYRYSGGSFCPGEPAGSGTYRVRTYTSAPTISTTDANGAPVVYPKVVEYLGTETDHNGYTVHLFKDFADTYAINGTPVEGTGPGIMENLSWRRGMPLKKLTYTKTGEVKAKTVNQYTLNHAQTNDKIGLLVYRVNENDYCSLAVLPSCPYSNSLARSFYFSYYSLKTGIEQLTGSTEYVYGGYNSDEFSHSTTYSYDNNYWQIKETNTVDSKGQAEQTLIKYPYDFASPGNVYQEMVDRNIISPVIEKTNKVATQIQSTEKINHLKFNAQFFKPSSVEISQQGGPSVTKITFNNYDVNGNLLSYTEQNGLTTNLTYWETAGKKYLVKSRTTGSQTTQYDYIPLVGLSSQTDPNGRATAYQYDPFNRLTKIFDHQNRLLKEFCYQFNGLPVNCAIGSFIGTVANNTNAGLLEDLATCIPSILRSAGVPASQSEKDFACTQITIQAGFTIGPGAEYEGSIKQP